MIGLLLGFLTRPHAVGSDGTRVRSGAELDLPFGWADVAAVRRHRGMSQGKQPLVSTDAQGQRAQHLRMQQETNLELRLRRPVTVRLARGPEQVSSVHLWAEAPGAFVRAVEEYGTG